MEHDMLYIHVDVLQNLCMYVQHTGYAT